MDINNYNTYNTYIYIMATSSLTPVELTRESFKGLLDFNSKQGKHTILTYRGLVPPL